MLTACGGGGDGPRVQAKPQHIGFGVAPALVVDASMPLVASASSGLPPRFTSLTPSVCDVDAVTGAVTGVAAGQCRVAADQSGNDDWAVAPQQILALAVAGRAQVLRVDAAPSVLPVGDTLRLAGQAGSGLPVVFASLTPTVCGVASDGLLSGLAEGRCEITATQAGSSRWAAAEAVQQALAVQRRTQTVSFDAAPALVVAGTAAVAARSDGGQPVVYRSTTPAVCAVDPDSGALRGLAAGTCSVLAEQPGDSAWAPAQAVQSLAVLRRVQKITLSAAPTLTVGDSVTATGNASSGLPLAWRSLSASVCSVGAASGQVSGLAEGACNLAADQPGDATWEPAATVPLAIVVARRAQSLQFAAVPALQVGGSTPLSVSANSGLAVQLRSLSPAVCRVDGAGSGVTALAAGSCSLAADQPGNAQWLAAAQVVQTVSVTQLPQRIDFGSAPLLTAGASTTLVASATSGLSLRFNSLTPAVCSVQAGSGVVSALTAGSCIVSADQAGNGTWAAAPQAVQVLAVDVLRQNIVFAPAPALLAGGMATVQASASSGLAVSYSSLTPAVCSVQAASGVVSAVGAGLCTLAADQAGSANWAAAPQATLALTASLRSQVLSVGSAPALLVGGSAVLVASASSGLAVAYGSLTPAVCSVQPGSGQVSGLTAGSCSVSIGQPGSALWAAAAPVVLSLAVVQRSQTISFGSLPVLRVGSSGAVAASASSGLPVAFGSLTPAVCSVQAASGLVSGLAAGSCGIVVNQAGDTAWAAAAATSVNLAVAVNPVQSIRFGTAPLLSLGGTAIVGATASSGLAVRFSSLTPTVCGVQPDTGLVTDLALGDCTIAADQPGDSRFNPAPQQLLTLAVQVPAGVTVPGMPSGVSATLGGDMRTVLVQAASVSAGGHPIGTYTVLSTPAGIRVDASALPVTVRCASSCAGLAFSLQATNGMGNGPASAAVDVLTTFDVVTTFREPDTQPRDTLFTGSFTLNSTTGAIALLDGQLTESMTGNAVGSAPYYDMTQVRLRYQLHSARDATLGGRFVASFAKNTTSTFATLAGGDGWSPQAGIANGGVYAGFPSSYRNSVQNSYVLVFVPDDPFVPLTQAQIDRLSYADCAPGGMMGAVCMTATSQAGHGAVGTMSGFPVSQRLTRR